jgi:hypothetical protein
MNDSKRNISSLLIVLIAVAGLCGYQFAQSSLAAEEGAKGAKVSQAAFIEAYKVFMHPRCMNCHPNGDRPLQGDDSHIHAQNVQRGPDGKGLFALKCANCHQDTNLPGANMPPGNPNWHLLPPEMPMVFEGRSPRELALQMVDTKQNGGKSLAELLHHVTEDPLVKWGWNPGDGRTLPPLTHEDFAKQMKVWINNGAVAPD